MAYKLEIVLIILNVTTVLMLLISLLMYIASREGRALHMLYFWVATAVNTVCAILTAHSSEKWIATAGSTVVLMTVALSKILEDLAGRPIQNKMNCCVLMGGMIAFFAGMTHGLPFWAYTLMLVITLNYYGFYALVSCIRAISFKKLNPLHYFFFFGVIIFNLHMFNYCFLRLDPTFAFKGFLIAVFEVITIAATLPGLIIQEYQTERGRFLELLLKERTLQLERQSKMSSLGEMTASLVHELNNPITLLLTRNGLLRRKVERDQIEKAELLAGLGQMDSTIQRMMKITQSMRTFSRNDTDDSMKVVSLSAIVDETISFSMERFVNGNTPLLVGKISDVHLECRSVQISQVLLNLLNNAYDAVSGNHDRWVRIDFDIAEKMVRIVVTDSGAGIPEDVRAKIMQPFFTTKEAGRGTGLGLSISQSIAREHGGKLYLDTHTLNTCFVLELPLIDVV